MIQVKTNEVALEAKKDGVYRQVSLVNNMKIASIDQKQFIQSAVDMKPIL
jgi:hypothetical protein